jgi:hypothetical protein
MEPELEPILLMVSLLIVGGVIVYVASRAFGVKSWRGASLIILTLITIPAVCYIVSIFTMVLLSRLAFS